MYIYPKILFDNSSQEAAKSPYVYVHTYMYVYTHIHSTLSFFFAHDHLHVIFMAQDSTLARPRSHDCRRPGGCEQTLEKIRNMWRKCLFKCPSKTLEIILEIYETHICGGYGHVQMDKARIVNY